MRRRFLKMHGLGNDFVVFDARDEALALNPQAVRAIADRNFGVGCDQLIVIEPSTVATAFMRIYNADGTESGACGNATRCVATLLGERATIETLGGLLDTVTVGDGASVDMGPARLDWSEVPLAYAMDTAALPLGWDVETLRSPMAVNVGNPHAVLFVADCDAIDLARAGPPIAEDPVFPNGVNAGFATVEDRGHIRLRVWERGAGATLACGTGACAAAVCAIRAGLVDSGVTVTLPGGPLVIDWSPGGRIVMTGPATNVFSGELELAAFA